jgi:hypothetical protein
MWVYSAYAALKRKTPARMFNGPTNRSPGTLRGSRQSPSRQRDTKEDFSSDDPTSGRHRPWLDQHPLIRPIRSTYTSRFVHPNCGSRDRRYRGYSRRW